MNKSAIYMFQHQFVGMDGDKVAQVLLDLEKSLRTGTFKYKKPSLSKKQYEEIKQSWSPEAHEFFKSRATKIAGDQKVTPEIAYQAAVATVSEFIPEARRKNTAVVKEETPLDKKRTLLDIYLSSMMNVAFEASNTPTNMKIIAGKKIETRFSYTANMFRVDCEDVGNADFFVFSLYNEIIEKPIFIGWKNQSEVRACRRGNKNTDNNCMWEKMSFYFTYPELNPMSDLLTQFGIKELPEGILLEQVTQLHYLPIPNNDLSRMLTMDKNTKPSDDFYKVLGLENPPITPVQPAPTTQEQSVNSDDWAM